VTYPNSEINEYQNQIEFSQYQQLKYKSKNEKTN